MAKMLYCCVVSLQPDVVLLDINMPKLDGMGAAQQIKAFSDACVVFVTAYDHHALEAFRNNALDYLTKPIKDSEFNLLVDKVRQRVTEKRAYQNQSASSFCEPQGHLRRIALKQGEETRLFETGSIESVTSVKDYLCIRIDGEVYIHRHTMKQMEALLDPATFLRCHRSHLVNVNRVSALMEDEGGTWLVCPGERHPVSRRYRKAVKLRLG